MVHCVVIDCFVGIATYTGGLEGNFVCAFNCIRMHVTVAVAVLQVILKLTCMLIAVLLTGPAPPVMMGMMRPP